jgi:hypothetical protein
MARPKLRYNIYQGWPDVSDAVVMIQASIPTQVTMRLVNESEILYLVYASDLVQLLISKSHCILKTGLEYETSAKSVSIPNRGNKTMIGNEL